MIWIRSSQGRELGVYLYMMTGGEPLVRKADILRLAEKRNDVELSIYLNSTLIDEDFCKEVVRLGNITSSFLLKERLKPMMRAVVTVTMQQL